MKNSQNKQKTDVNKFDLNEDLNTNDQKEATNALADNPRALDPAPSVEPEANESKSKELDTEIDSDNNQESTDGFKPQPSEMPSEEPKKKDKKTSKVNNQGKLSELTEKILSKVRMSAGVNEVETKFLDNLSRCEEVVLSNGSKTDDKGNTKTVYTVSFDAPMYSYQETFDTKDEAESYKSDLCELKNSLN